jgi:transcriptional regulator with XRE-family HTH domain
MEEARKLLGRRIRYLRNLRGMTQEQLGDKADVNYKYLGAIERGEKNPATDNLAKIAGALDVKLHEIFTFEHEIEDTQLLKKKIDDLLKDASIKELKAIYRVIEAILR